jgi:EF hand
MLLVLYKRQPQETEMRMMLMVTCFFVLSPAIAMAADDFPKLDSNKDGQVTIEELTAAGINWNKEQFAAADTDGSKTLSKAEYEAAASQ